MLNFKDIENRIKKHKGLSESRDVAALLKMTPQNYSNKKGLGTLLPSIIDWAIQENVNLDWLINGDKKGSVSESDTRYSVLSDMEEILLRIIKEGDKTKEIVLKAVLSALDPGKNKAK